MVIPTTAGNQGWEMARRRAMTVAVAMVAVVAVGLAGCGGDDSAQDPSPEAPSQESSSTTASEPGDPAADCLVGEWSLDTGDYQGQAFDYLSGLGIPLETLTIGGEQVVGFQERGVIDERTNLTVDAVVYGVPLSVVSQTAGNGEWSTAGGALTIENWIWGIAPTPAGAGQPSVPFFDPSTGAATAICSGDTLQLQGAGAPLVGNFVRL